MGTGVDTEASLLYLEIDLGPQPLLATLSGQVESLVVLTRHCDLLASKDAAGLNRREQALIHLLASGLSDKEAAQRLNMQARNVGDVRRRAQRQAGVLPTRVVRTSLASPWVTVLGSLAEASQPIAYGTAGLIGLQRLMTMVMQWQRHQVQIERDRAELRQLLEDHAGRPDVPGVVVAAAERLGTVAGAEMIEPNDPRAHGRSRPDPVGP